jgi:hypothetical protein
LTILQISIQDLSIPKKVNFGVDKFKKTSIIDSRKEVGDMKIAELKKQDRKLYDEVIRKTSKYKNSKVLHQSSKHYRNANGELVLESTKIYSNHQRIDRAILDKQFLRKLNAIKDVQQFRAELDKIAEFGVLCKNYAVRHNLASHAREHSHCYRRVARALGRPDLYKHMLFGKTQKKLAPITLAKIAPDTAKAKTGKLIRARARAKVMA